MDVVPLPMIGCVGMYITILTTMGWRLFNSVLSRSSESSKVRYFLSGDRTKETFPVVKVTTPAQKACRFRLEHQTYGSIRLALPIRRLPDA